MKKETTRLLHTVRTFEGHLEHYTEMGEISAFVVMANGRTGFDAVFSLEDLDNLKVIDPKTKVLLWEGNPKSKNLKGMMEINYIGRVPLTVKDAKLWATYFTKKYPCKFSGRMISWGERSNLSKIRGK